MNDQIQPEEMPGRACVGAVLSAARSTQGLTVAQVATSLRLTPAQIDAIEADDFGTLRGAVFSRGYVSNYARLLGLDAAPLLSAMARTARRYHVPADERLLRDVTGVVINARRTGSAYMAAIGCAAVVVLLAFYEFGFNAASGVTPLPASSIPTGPAVGPAVNMSEPQVQQQAGAKSADVMAVDEKPAGDASVKRGLHFMFAQESWVEVRDGVNNILFSKINPPGTEQVVEGKPPFKLIIGGAGGVQLAYNGSPVNLMPYATEDVARLRLD